MTRREFLVLVAAFHDLQRRTAAIAGTVEHVEAFIADVMSRDAALARLASQVWLDHETTWLKFNPPQSRPGGRGERASDSSASLNG